MGREGKTESSEKGREGEGEGEGRKKGRGTCVYSTKTGYQPVECIWPQPNSVKALDGTRGIPLLKTYRPSVLTATVSRLCISVGCGLRPLKWHWRLV